MLSLSLALLVCSAASVALPEGPREHFATDGQCTATAVDCAATADGGCIAASTADGGPLDFRVVYVPPKTYGPGQKRAVYINEIPGAFALAYPRIVDASRAPSYAPVGDQKPSVATGYVDMPVGTTYGYWDSSYGIMNEAGVSMGESTCSARMSSVPRGDGPDGKGAVFWIGELSDIGLELCDTARCAVKTMGYYAEKYGYYGSGEALVVADGEEVWVFHVTPDDTAESAVWAAQRVPKGHATIVPNTFIIRYIDPADGDNFLYSDNMYDIALRYGWWDGSGLLDFAYAFGAGEQGHPYVSGRRIWRGLSLFAPSLNLDPTLGVEWEHPTYPFSVKPDVPITIDFMRRLYRDHMEGTPYDLTNHVVAGGPFKTPVRYPGGRAEATFQHGAWERAISEEHSYYGFIAVTYKDKYNVVYFAPSSPHGSLFVPIIVKPNQTVKSIPCLEYAWQGEVNTSSLWWAAETVTNVMDLKYMYMINDVRKAQFEIEHKIDVMMATESSDDIEEKMADYDNSIQREWMNMHYTLLGKYQNGYTNWGYSTAGYGPSTEWLRAAGFQDFQATPEQFAALRKRYEETQKQADAIRDAALGARTQEL
ncbi:hypothetical protein FOL47_004592 [Perkinsus chesapeaki]|uniref:Dipeptidase n=1 Tax=Perkinsus chesapeaki TaxID=330153 RepID=A0A7J6MZ31_PERCH|nr:hypothetical protein FOL47_004592 [Perkinsus chesapeaki]